jgi:transcription factor MYB, plant
VTLETGAAPVSPEQSVSTSTTSTTTDYSAASSSLENADSFTSEEEDYQIDDSFWSETLAMAVDSSDSGMEEAEGAFGASPPAPSTNDDVDFWLKLFMQASDMQNSPQIYA